MPNNAIPMTVMDNSTAAQLQAVEGISVDVSGKADKVTGATAGDLAALDENGNLTDSGKAPEDFLEAPASAGTQGQVLTADGEGGASWQDPTGGDPTEIIDDNAGSGDTDKVWSADKSSSLLTEIVKGEHDDIFAQNVLENGSAVYDLTYTNRNVNDSTGEQSGESDIRTSTPGLYYVPFECKVYLSNYDSSTHLIQAYCFDENNEYIAPCYSWDANKALNLSNGTRFVRFYMQNRDNSSITPAEAKSYATLTCVYGGRIEETENIVEELVAITDNIIRTHIGKNLANPEKFAIGYLQSTGVVEENNNYRTTDFIPVENGKSYAIGSYYSYNTIANGRYGYLLYDESKNPISDDYENTDNLNGMVFTVTDSDAKYVRCFCRYATGRTIMVCEGASVPATPTQYEESVKLTIELDDVPMEQVEEATTGFVYEAFNKYDVPVLQTKQLFDRSKVTVGYCSNTGYIDPSTSYVYTEKIPVAEGETLYFSVDGDPSSARFVCAYDENGSPVSASGSGSSVSSYIVPSGIVEVRLTYTNPAVTAKYAHFQAEYDEITGYVPYGKFFNIDDYMGKDNVLYGKKWAVCGDSFTDGVLDTTIQTGRYTGKRIVYPYLIGNRNNMEIVKFFNGGQTLAFPATPGDFTNSLTNPNGERYYQNIPEDVDYITIYLGINDSNHAPGGSASGEIPIGTISDETTATYLGAWNVVLSWLIENRPYAHIGIIVTNGNSDDAYRQGQIAISKKYGLPYIDMNGDERTPSMHRTSNPDIASAVKTVLLEKWRVSATNTHPNDAAHEFESTFIENFLRSI